MTFSARTLGTSLTALTLASLLSWPAAAQTAAPTAAPAAPEATAKAAQPHAKHRAHGEHLQQRHAQRLAQMKTLLQLQPQQEAAWQRYVQAITPQAPERHAHKPGKRAQDAAQPLTTLERLDRAQALRQARHDAAQLRDQATRTFYASLSESQQKAFDTLHQRQGPRKGWKGPHHQRSGHGPQGPQHGFGPGAAPTR